MVHFPITENVKSALALAGRVRRDDLGYCYYTFRIALTRTTGNWSAVLSELIDAGWQMQGGPYVVEATDGAPRHLVLSMLHAALQPPRIQGDLTLHGESRKEARD